MLRGSPGSDRARRSEMTRLLLWDSGLLDHLSPLVDVGFEPGRNVLRRARFRLDAKLKQPSFDLRVGEYILQRAVERLDDLRRGAGGCKQRVPGDDVVTGNAAFPHRGQI